MRREKSCLVHAKRREGLWTGTEQWVKGEWEVAIVDRGSC